MPAIRISVVIPLYNKENEIIRTLDSVFAQLRQPDEVIVVDDGSDDHGPMLAEEKYGGRIRLIKQANQGVSAARNEGVRQAASPFVCLLDADDGWMPGFLYEIESLVQRFPSAAFYSANVRYVDEANRHIPAAIARPPDFFGEITDFAHEFSKGYSLVSSSSVCLRKSFFDEGLIFPAGITKGEDIFLWLQLGMKGRLAFSAKPLVNIYLNASNRSHDNKGVLPYHISWYLDNKAVIGKLVSGKSIRNFILGNAIVTAYGLAMAGDRHAVRLIMKAFYRHREYLFLAIIPALILPCFILKLFRSIRHRIRA